MKSQRRGADRMLEGWALAFTQGYVAGAPILRRALGELGSDTSDLGQLEMARWTMLTARHLWEDTHWDTLSRRYVDLAREAGALGELPLALSPRSYLQMVHGEFAAAAATLEEARGARDNRQSSALYQFGTAVLAGPRGDERGVLTAVETSAEDVSRRGEGVSVAMLSFAQVVLYNGLGIHAKALAPAERAAPEPIWALAEIAEAAARSGEPDMGAGAAERLSEMAHAAGTHWVLGVAARSRPLLSAGTTAEGLYREALEHLGQCQTRLDLARAHLVYGEWLRRQRRRAEARQQLRLAHRLFTPMGANAFAARAERGLRASGEHARIRTNETRYDLTPQERQIATLAQSGLSNTEIGSRLFISPRTAEYHLGKVFSKLGIRTRRELEVALRVQQAGSRRIGLGNNPRSRSE